MTKSVHSLKALSDGFCWLWFSPLLQALSGSGKARVLSGLFTAGRDRPGAATHTRTFKRRRGVVRMGVAVDDEEEPTKQMKEMAAARRRWDALIRNQKIKALTPKEAGYTIQ